MALCRREKSARDLTFQSVRECGQGFATESLPRVP